MAVDKIQGRATIKVNGVAFRSKNGATFNQGGYAREWVGDDQGGGGYKETEATPASVTCTLVVGESFLLSDYDFTDATVEFNADNGLSFSFTGGFRVEPLAISGGEAEIQIQGLPATQL